MNKNIVYGVVGCVAGVAIAGIAAWSYLQNVGPEVGSAAEPKEQKPMEPVVHSPIKPEALERLPEENSGIIRTNKGRFIISGRGEDANWGFSKTANFQYTADVISDSEVLEKNVLPGGKIKVTELRTFRHVADSMVASDADFKINLKDTVNIKAISKAIDVAAGLWTAGTGDVTTAGGVKVVKDFAEKQLENIEGQSVSGIAKRIGEFLGFEGDAQTLVQKGLDKLAGAKLTKALGNVRKISGKSYLVSYYQEADGQPLHATFKNEDGSDIFDEEEQMVLKRVNSFMNYALVPDKKCRPGDTWKADASDFQELFDPFVDGEYRGTLKLKREADNADGDWIVSAAPAEIRIVSVSGTGNGKSTGALQLKHATATLDPKTITLKRMEVDGDARLTKLSKHHWLFTAKLSGDCAFEGVLFVEEKKK